MKWFYLGNSIYTDMNQSECIYWNFTFTPRIRGAIQTTIFNHAVQTQPLPSNWFLT